MTKKRIMLPGMYKGGETWIFGKCVKDEVEEDNEGLLANSVVGSPSGMAT